MPCREIMSPNPALLHPADTVGHAVSLLLAQRVLSLPVVDDQGRYLGMFAKSRLFSLLLPTVVAIDEILPRLAQLPDLGFLSDDIDDLRERLQQISGRSVGEYLDQSVPVMRPDTPVMAAVLLFYRQRNFLPVVEAQDGRLVGVISTWDTLARINTPAS